MRMNNSQNLINFSLNYNFNKGCRNKIINCQARFKNVSWKKGLSYRFENSWLKTFQRNCFKHPKKTSLTRKLIFLTCKFFPNCIILVAILKQKFQIFEILLIKRKKLENFWQKMYFFVKRWVVMGGGRG